MNDCVSIVNQLAFRRIKVDQRKNPINPIFVELVDYLQPVLYFSEHPRITERFTEHYSIY